MWLANNGSFETKAATITSMEATVSDSLCNGHFNWIDVCSISDFGFADKNEHCKTKITAYLGCDGFILDPISLVPRL